MVYIGIILSCCLYMLLGIYKSINGEENTKLTFLEKLKTSEALGCLPFKYFGFGYYSLLFASKCFWVLWNGGSS